MKILKFGASWCQPCKQLTKLLSEVTNPYTVDNIDIDEQTDVAMEYGVRSIPTLVLLNDNNNPVARLNGTITKKQLEEFICGVSG